MSNTNNLISLLEGMSESLDKEKTVSVNICPSGLVNDVLGVRLGEPNITYKDTPLKRLIDAKSLRGNTYVELAPADGQIHYYTDLATAWNNSADGTLSGNTDSENAAVCTFTLDDVVIVRLLCDTALTSAESTPFSKGILLDLNGHTLTATDMFINCAEDMMFYGIKDGSRVDLNYTSTSTDSSTLLAMFTKCIRFYGGEYYCATQCKKFVLCQTTKAEIRFCRINYTDNFATVTTDAASKTLFYTNQTDVLGSDISAECPTDGIKSKMYGFYNNIGNHRYVDTNLSLSTVSDQINCGIYASNVVCSLHTQNCNISVNNGGPYFSNSIGVYTKAPSFLVDTNVSGLHSAIQSHSFLYIKGGRYESISHGGIYTGGGCLAFIEDITTVRLPDPPEKGFINASGGTYFGYGSRCFCNNVTFINELTNRQVNSALTLKQGVFDQEVKTEVHLTNCTCYPALVRVDGDEWIDPAKTAMVNQELYIGDNVKLLDGENEITVTADNIASLTEQGNFVGSGGLGNIQFLDTDSFSIFKTV